MCECHTTGKVKIVYTNVKKKVEVMDVCRRCDCTELWPNWRRGLKYR